jgi:hypothetical protein
MKRWAEMSVAADLSFFMSSGEGSSGGPISTLEIPVDQPCLAFSALGPLQLKNGWTDYVKVFAVNTSPTDTITGAILWTLMQPAYGQQVSLGIGGPSDSDGTVIPYSQPTQDSPIVLGNLAPGQAVAIWVQRSVAAGAPRFEAAFFQAAIEDSDLQDPGVLIPFAWYPTPPPPENTDMAILAYELNLQATNESNRIATQADVSDRFPLTSDIIADDTYALAAGTIDQPINVPASGFDTLVLIPKFGPVAAKINGTTGTPFTIRKAMFVDGQAMSSVFLSNPNQGVINVRAILAKR